MICPVCETHVRDGAAFCPQCGTHLNELPAEATRLRPAAVPTSQQPPTRQYPTTSYGQPGPTQSNLQWPSSQTSSPQANKKNLLVPIVAGIATMAAVLVAAGLFFALRNRGIAIDEKNFPDESLRTWAKENADENGDGHITEVEAHKVIVIEAERVTNTKGIEHFVNAEQILLPNSGLTTFDLGENEYPNLTVIDFSGSKNLEKADLSKAKELEQARFTDTPIKFITIYDPDTTELIDVPDGVTITYPNGPSDDQLGTPKEPATSPSITWFVPISYHSIMAYSDTVFETTSTATYDDEGRLVHMEHVNPDESGSIYYTETADYSYDDQGRLVHVDVKSGDTLAYQWDLTYSNDSCRASCTNSDSSGEFFINYNYDTNGRVQSCSYKTISANGIIEGSVEVSYDSEGRIANVEGTEGGGYSQVRIAASYHDNGRIARIVDSDGNTTTTYTYDEQGHLTGYELDGYTPDNVSYTYGDGPLPTGMSRSAGGSLSSSDNTLQASVPTEYYTTDYTIEYAEIETPIDVTPLLGIGAIDFTHPNQYGDPWIHATLRPFGTRDILQANEVWLAQRAAGVTQEEPAAEAAVSSNAEPEQPTYQCGQMPDGSFVLVGTVHTHRETVIDREVDVVSMTLDEPVNYMFEYKGTVSEETAREVCLTTSSKEDYEQWRAYDGKHVAVCCYELRLAYHDNSYLKVDSLASNDVYLLE